MCENDLDLLLLSEWIEKMWYDRMAKCYLVLKKDFFYYYQLGEKMYMIREDILSEICQLQKISCVS